MIHWGDFRATALRIHKLLYGKTAAYMENILKLKCRATPCPWKPSSMNVNIKDLAIIYSASNKEFLISKSWTEIIHSAQRRWKYYFAIPLFCVYLCLFLLDSFHNARASPVTSLLIIRTELKSILSLHIYDKIVLTFLWYDLIDSF